jgi:hypothetical protein
MAEDAEEFLRRSREIERIKEAIRDVQERIGLLDDKVSGVHRALVELKALNISQTILNNLWVEVVGSYLSEELVDNNKIKMRNEILSE